MRQAVARTRLLGLGPEDEGGNKKKSWNIDDFEPEVPADSDYLSLSRYLSFLIIT